MNHQYNYIVFILLLLSLCCYNCHNDNHDDTISQKTANILVQYRDSDGLYTDYGAKVFIYYGIYSMDIAEFNYSSDGILIYGDQKIIPNLKAVISKEDTFMIRVSSTQKITIIIESSYFKGRTAINSYSPNSMPIKLHLIFEK